MTQSNTPQSKTPGSIEAVREERQHPCLVEINWDKLEAYCSFDLSATLCAYLLGIGRDTLERRIRRKYGKTFGEYKSLFLEHTAFKLKQKLIGKALEKGDNACLIFALKNIGGWSDTPKGPPANTEKVFKLAYSNEEFKELENAAKERNIPKDRYTQYQEIDEGGETAESSNSDSAGTEEEGQEEE